MGLSTFQGVHVWAHKDGLRWLVRIDGYDFSIAIEGDELRAYDVTRFPLDGMRPYSRRELAELPPTVLEMLVRCIHRVAANR